MIETVDEDGSGKIELDEFMLIIKNTTADEKMAQINKFFKDMSSGVLDSQDLSFTMIVQKIRRKYMMEALLCDPITQSEKQQVGKRIMKNVRESLVNNRKIFIKT